MRYVSRRIMLVTAVVAAGVATLAGVTSASTNRAHDAIQIKINTVLPEATPEGQTWDHFKDDLEKRLGDKVDVKIYFNNALFTQADEVPALQQGNINFVDVTPAQLVGLDPKIVLFDLPYLFKSTPMLEAAVADKKIGGAVFAPLASSGLQILGAWDNSWREFATDKPINTVSDLHGLKIRVQAGANATIAWLKRLGAVPIVMDFSQVPTALQQGLLDGQEPPPTGLAGGKIYKLDPNLTLTHHVLQSIMIVTNSKWYAGLPPDVKSGVAAAMKDTLLWNASTVGTQTGRTVQQMMHDGLKLKKLSPSALQPFVNAGVAVQNSYAKVVGKSTLALVRALGQKYRWQRPNWH